MRDDTPFQIAAMLISHATAGEQPGGEHRVGDRESGQVHEHHSEIYDD